jgi:hypothetical protein
MTGKIAGKAIKSINIYMALDLLTESVGLEGT